MADQTTQKSPFTAAGLACGLILLVLAVYSPVLSGEFIWDDDTHLTANVLARPHGLYRSWFTQDQSNYWPITWTALWLQWQAWGANPVGYHVVTVMLHAVCALLLWRLLARLGVKGAWLAALIFAVHPVNVETGAWITQQKNLLSLCFGVSALIVYLHDSCVSGRPGLQPALSVGRRHVNYAFSIVLFLVSLLAKTATVPLPVIMLGCVWWKQGTIRRRDILRSLPFFGLSLALSLNEIWFQYYRAMAVDVRTDSLIERIAKCGHAVLFYLGKIVCPYNLNFVYPNPSFGVASVTAWLPMVALALVLLLALMNYRGWGRALIFGMGCYIVMLLPVLGLLNIYFMRYSWVSDHWQYTGIVAPIALIVAAFCDWSRLLSAGSRRIAVAAAALIVVAFSVQSFQRAKLFRNSEALWRDTIWRNPGAWMARNNYASMLMAQGRLDEAAAQLAAALKADPDGTLVRLNLARLMLLRGNPTAAAGFLEENLRHKPDDAETNYELGRIRMMQGDLVGARGNFEAVLRKAPRLGGAWVGIGLIEERNGRFDEAVGFFEKGVIQDPENAELLHTVANQLFAHGMVADAVKLYRRVVALDPSRRDIHNDLGIAYARQGDLAAAIAEFELAVKAAPGDEKARLNLEKARADAATTGT